MDYTDLSSTDLEDLLVQLFGLHTGSLAMLIELLPVLEERESWHQDGCPTFDEWVAMRFGVPLGQAHQWLEVARRLTGLPALRAAFRDGLLSYEQVSHLVWLATPDDEQTWVREAPELSPTALQRLARRARRITREQELEDHRTRRLRLWWDEQRRRLHLSGDLPADQGAVLETTLARLTEKMPPDPETGEFEPIDARRADALLELAGTRLASESDAERATVVVHVDADRLAGREGTALVDDRVAIGDDTLRRLTCDARIEWLAEDEHGTALGIGRASRNVPAFLMRRLRKRDGRCRFPGCERRWGVQAHHIEHWADGGRTDEGNLLLLCRHHHRVMHRPGWQLLGPADRARFIRPDGRVQTAGPRAVGDSLRRRFPWLWPEPPPAMDTG